MLPFQTEFPQIGSYALIQIEGRLQLARLQERFEDGRVLISLPLVPHVATGSSRVPLSDLIDGTPLTAAEQEELRRLSAELTEPKRHAARKVARASALRERDIHAELMARMVAKVPLPMRRGALGAPAL